MSARPPEDPLKSLHERIEAARDAQKPKTRPKGGKYAAAGFGWRMTVDLVTGVFVGAAMGWGLDSLLGTMPLFLIVMVLLGFAAGVRVMLMSAAEYQKEQAAAEEDDAKDG
ncbi:MAG: AtpZ/AtpI family protein [Pseudomonadota bacterium]